MTRSPRESSVSSPFKTRLVPHPVGSLISLCTHTSRARAPVSARNGLFVSVCGRAAGCPAVLLDSVGTLEVLGDGFADSAARVPEPTAAEDVSFPQPTVAR